MKLNKLLLLCFLSFAIYSCSDENENPPIETPQNLEAEKQIKGVIDVLKDEQDLSAFREALTGIDAKIFSGTEFTVLAYKNQISPKATFLAKSDSIRELETMRHIIGGRYTFEQLSKLKKLVALSRDTLYIAYSETDRSITINGILLGKSIVSDKSIVFVTDATIPQAKDTTTIVEKEYVFRVMNINSKWKAGENEGSGVAEGAIVNIFQDEKLIKGLKTDANGTVRFSYNEDVELDYIVKTDTSSMLYHNYFVGGLYTTQEQVDLAPRHEEFRAVLGGLKFVDTNGDGVIDSDDMMDREELKNLSDDMVIYLVGKSYIYPKDEVTSEMVETAYTKAYNTYLSIDSDPQYSTLSGRQKINKSDSRLYNLWDQSYQAMELINRGIEQVDKNSNISEQEKSSASAEYKEKRAELYFVLATLFGNIPIQLDSKLNSNISQTTQEEAYTIALSDYKYAIGNTADSVKNNILLKTAFVYRGYKDWQSTYATCNEVIQSELSDTMSINRRIYQQALCLSVETSVNLGNINQALNTLNELLIFKGKNPLYGVSADKILETVKNEFSLIDQGVKIANALQWNNMGTLTLLPIPQKAIEDGKTGSLIQNQGW